MKIKTGLLFIILLLFANLSFAQTKDLGLVIGIGIGVHTFSESDDTRKASDASTDDEIKAAVGSQLYIEYYFTDMLALGLKSQSLTGGVDYIYSNATVERRIQIDNSIIYLNFLYPLGSGYWRIGGTGGTGSSKYTSSWEIKCDSTGGGCTNKKIEESSNGTVIDLGFLIDWGEDASGGRLGFITSTMSHDNLPDNDTEVKASGSQFFIDFRYAF